jgi:hypothetical protein
MSATALAVHARSTLPHDSEPDSQARPDAAADVGTALVPASTLVRQVADEVVRACGRRLEIVIEHPNVDGAVSVDAAAMELTMASLALHLAETTCGRGRLLLRCRNVELTSGIEPSPSEVAPGRYVSVEMVSQGLAQRVDPEASMVGACELVERQGAYMWTDAETLLRTSVTVLLPCAA